MKSRLRLLALPLLVALAVTAGPAAGQETQPGDPCPVTGRFMRSGGVEIPNGHFMVCNGSNWVSVIDYLDTGHTLTQVGNDSANPCTVAKEGRISYTGGDPPWEYCDGSDWRPFESAAAGGGLPDCYNDTTEKCILAATRSASDLDFVSDKICQGINILGVTGSADCGATCGNPVEWTTPGSYIWQVPPGCSEITIETYGAGGGGARHGGSNDTRQTGGGGGGSLVETSGGTLLVAAGGGGGGGVTTGSSGDLGGGGGGGYAKRTITVTPGDNLTVYVGGGGSSGCNDTSGGDGGPVDGGNAGSPAENSDYGGGGGGQGTSNNDDRGGTSVYGGGGGSRNSGGSGSSTYGGAGGRDNGSCASTNGGACNLTGGGGGGGFGDTVVLGSSGHHFTGGSGSPPGGAAAFGGPGAGAAGGTGSGLCSQKGGDGKVVIMPGSGQDIEPDSFTFTDLVAVNPNSLETSDIVEITGISGDVAISLSGNGNPEYRLCATADCSIAGSWTSAAGTVNNGWYVQLRLTSSPGSEETHSANIVVGASNADWNVTTKVAGAPDPFSFTDLTDVPLSELRISDIVQITGITNDGFVGISGDGNPEYRICNDDACAVVAETWTSSARIIAEGQYLQARLTSSASYETTHSATVTVDGGNALWNVTTEQSPFSCTPGSQDFTSAATYQLSITTDMALCTFSISMRGGGGGGGDTSSATGGAGGTVAFDFEPNNTGTLHIMVGGGGLRSSSGGTGAGGFGGGGDGQSTSGARSGGGGGATALRLDDTILAIVGGGGGSGDIGSGSGGSAGFRGSNNECGAEGGNSGGQGGCNDVGGDGGGGSNFGGDGGSGGGGGQDGNSGVSGGGGFPDFGISGGGGSGSPSSGCASGGGGGGYGGGGGGRGGCSDSGGGGGGGYLNMPLITGTPSTFSAPTATGHGADGFITIEWND